MVRRLGPVDSARAGYWPATPCDSGARVAPVSRQFGVVGLEQQPASYYRAAAARARRLRAEATTRRLRSTLGRKWPAMNN
jgi:hypothetical protein